MGTINHPFHGIFEAHVLECHLFSSVRRFQYSIHFITKVYKLLVTKKKTIETEY